MTPPWRHRGWPTLLIGLVVGAMLLAAYIFASGGEGAVDAPQGRTPAAGRPIATATPAATPTLTHRATPTPAPRPANQPIERQVAAPLAKSAPTRLRIPVIGVDTALMALGLNGDGTLETPPGAYPAGWFTGAPTPGEQGPAIIAGHVRYNTAGVFLRLTELRTDDEISVARADGSTATFRVTRLERFAKSSFPTDKVYGDIAHAGLRLITCGGLDASTNEFEDNVVVFADLVT